MAAQRDRLLVPALAAGLLFAGTARADDGVTYGQQQCAGSECSSSSHHPGLWLGCPGGTYPDAATIACRCMDQCGGGTAGGGGAGAALLEGVVYAIGYVALAAFAPGAIIDAAQSPQQVDEETKEAQQQWIGTLRDIAVLERVGGRALDAEAQMKQAVARLAAVQRGAARAAEEEGFAFQPPHLQPSLRYECDQAGVLAPDADGGPIAVWPSEAAMLAQCAPFLETPVDALAPAKCGAHVQVCCPDGYADYNVCDGKCYISSDFRGAPTEQGRHCAEDVSTVSQP